MAPELIRTILHFWPEWRQWLKAFPDPRLQPLIIYERAFLILWGMCLFLFKLRSRRQLDYDLDANGTQTLANLNRLAEAKQETRPVHKTMNNYFRRIGTTPLCELRTKMVQRLLRMKVLGDARLLGRYVLAIDATGLFTFSYPHCEHCLVRQCGTTTLYMHQVLEAKLLGPAGTVISLASEMIQNSDAKPGANAEEQKQDCELAALDRLAKTLKKEYPQLRVYLSGDALYACGRVLELCRQYGWSYVFTFKEGRLPSLWQEFQSLLSLCPGNKVDLDLPDKTHQVYRWVNDLAYEDSERRQHTLHALQCAETKPNGETTCFAWIVDEKISRENVIAIATKGGRHRWHVENQGFNTQKNSDLNLEHAYSREPRLMPVYYLLLQIAHLILQLLEKGNLLLRLAAAAKKTPLQLFGSLKNIARRLLESFRNYRIADEIYDVAAARHIQIRLSDTS